MLTHDQRRTIRDMAEVIVDPSASTEAFDAAAMTIGETVYPKLRAEKMVEFVKDDLKQVGG